MENQDQIALYIAYGCLAMGIFSTATVFFMFGYTRKMSQKSQLIHQLELEKKLIIFKSASEAEERERERIARNLHDEINLMLAVHKQVLEKHAFDIECNEFNSERYHDEIANIEKIREAVTACATNLVPAFLLNSGLTSTLEDHIRHINSAGKLKARCNVLLEPVDKIIFDKQEELNIYRICLELINNILKHAKPSALNMKISKNEEALLIEIDHNGTKITNADIEQLIQKKEGLGLKSIQARCLILNAKIDYFSGENQPAISCSVPFRKNRRFRKFNLPFRDNG